MLSFSRYLRQMLTNRCRIMTGKMEKDAILKYKKSLYIQLQCILKGTHFELVFE